jgi:hypothetical protein
MHAIDADEQNVRDVALVVLRGGGNRESDQAKQQSDSDNSFQRQSPLIGKSNRNDGPAEDTMCALLQKGKRSVSAR